MGQTLYHPQPNALLGSLGIEPSADPTTLMSPLGMAASGGQFLGGLKGVARLKELIARAMHHKKMTEEIGSSLLQQPAVRATVSRPASPPVFTGPEVERMQDIIKRWTAMPPRR